MSEKDVLFTPIKIGNKIEPTTDPLVFSFPKKIQLTISKITDDNKINVYMGC